MESDASVSVTMDTWVDVGLCVRSVGNSEVLSLVIDVCVEP